MSILIWIRFIAHIRQQSVLSARHGDMLQQVSNTYTQICQICQECQECQEWQVNHNY